MATEEREVVEQAPESATGRLTAMGEKLYAYCTECDWFLGNGKCQPRNSKTIGPNPCRAFKPRPEVEKSILSDEPQDWRSSKEVEKR